VNERGVKIAGQWHNVSKWAEDVVMPERGQTVRLVLDNGGFIRAIEPAGPTPIRQGAAGGPDLRELRIIRQCVLKAAVDRAAGRPDVSTSDVLKVAEAFEAWVLRPYDDPELTDAF